MIQIKISLIGFAKELRCSREAQALTISRRGQFTPNASHLLKQETKGDKVLSMGCSNAQELHINCMTKSFFYCFRKHCSQGVFFGNAPKCGVCRGIRPCDTLTFFVILQQICHQVSIKATADKESTHLQVVANVVQEAFPFVLRFKVIVNAKHRCDEISALLELPLAFSFHIRGYFCNRRHLSKGGSHHICLFFVDSRLSIRVRFAGVTNQEQHRRNSEVTVCRGFH